MKKIVTAIAATMILAPSLVLAKGDHKFDATIQYTGPVELTAVNTLLEDTSMFTEQNVVVEGHLLKQVNRDTFIFSDGNAEIQVELDDDINMATPIDATTKVRLYGEYEGGKVPEIEVEHLQVL